jgi:hypothetical protein
MSRATLSRLTLCIAIGALALTARAASAQPECPFVVDAAGGGDFTSIKAAVAEYKSFHNGSDCTIEVRPGFYGDTVTFDGVIGGILTGLEILADPGVTVGTGNARAFAFQGSGNITLRALPPADGETSAEIISGTNEPVAFQSNPPNPAGTYLVLEGWEIHDNNISGKDSACVDIASGNSNITVVNCNCHNNGSDAITADGGGPHFFLYNTIVDNRKSGFVLKNGVIATLAGNLLVSNGAAGGADANILISTKGGGADPQVTLLHNMAYGVDADIVGPFIDDPSPGSNLVTADLGGPGRPITDFLVDPANGDFRLAAGSPAIDAGLPLPDPNGLVPATDFEGTTRIDPSDIGWHERLADLDEDGVVDVFDNCPPIPGLNGNLTYNPRPQPGLDQPDLDQDGIGNPVACDSCPAVALIPGSPGEDPNNRGRHLDSDGDGMGDDCDADHMAAGCVASSDGSCIFSSFVEFNEDADTPTVPPACQVNLRLICSRDGKQIPIAHFYNTFEYPGSFEVFSAGDTRLVECDWEDYLPPLARTEGSVECRILYHTDIGDTQLDENGNCLNPDGCEVGIFGSPVSRHQLLSDPFTVIIDPAADDPDESCSHGFWKNNLALWPAGLSPGDSFDGIFGTDALPGLSLLDALNLGGEDIPHLARNGVAGLLSATDPNVAYALTPLQVIFRVQSAIDDDPPGSAEAVANTLLQSSEVPGGCPYTPEPL